MGLQKENSVTNQENSVTNQENFNESNLNSVWEETFKFGLYLNNEPIMERIFPADLYNQSIRYSINIRDISGEIINRIQKVLQKDNSQISTQINNIDIFSKYKDSLRYSLGNYNMYEYDYSKRNKNGSVVESKNNVKTNGQIAKGYYHDENEQFKFGLYLLKHEVEKNKTSSKIIIERNFFVERYNPKTRFSQELLDEFNSISFQIEEKIKQSDVSNIWDEFDIKNYYNYTIDKIRRMSKEERDKALFFINKERNKIKTMIENSKSVEIL
jgi:hypothetical protein